MSFRKQSSIIFSLIGLFFNHQLFADHLWAFGGGIGYVSTTAYVGSKKTVTLIAPIPYIKWQTDWFDLSEGDLNLNIWRETPFRLSFNFDLALPVDSTKTPVRNGMPNLDPVVQVGPLVSYLFNTDSDTQWQLDFPMMQSVSFSDNVEGVGWTFIPRVHALYHYKQNNYNNYDFEWSLGFVYSSEKYHDYYYSVDNSEATVQRPSYKASQGYAGYRMNISLSKRIQNTWMGFYIRYQNLSGAVYRDSPLVETDDYWVVGLGMSWIFAGSY